MTKLERLFTEQGQSPWLDNLSRAYLRDGTLGRYIADGVRGLTANPTIFARAIEGSATYDEQFSALVASGKSVSDAYWEPVIDEIVSAPGLLRPIYDESNGSDGFASIGVAPEIPHATAATVAAAGELHERIAQPNLLVKIPATPAGAPAIQAMIAEGRSINVTLIFSLDRYSQGIEAYLTGLEALNAKGGDLTAVHTVASVFRSRVDTEGARSLDARGKEGCVVTA